MASDTISEDRRQCIVRPCVFSEDKGNPLFFKFPSDFERASQWAIRCGRRDAVNNENKNETENLFICSEHFRKEDIIVNEYGTRRLSENALPSVFHKNILEDGDNESKPPPISNDLNLNPVVVLEDCLQFGKKNYLVTPITSDDRKKLPFKRKGSPVSRKPGPKSRKTVDTTAIFKQGLDRCAARDCNNSRSNHPNIAYFPFPRDSERCRQWARNANRFDLLAKSTDFLNRNVALCSAHFHDDQFFNAFARKRLIWDAVPNRQQKPSENIRKKPGRPAKNPANTSVVKKILPKLKVIPRVSATVSKQSTEKVSRGPGRPPKIKKYGRPPSTPSVSFSAPTASSSTPSTFSPASSPSVMSVDSLTPFLPNLMNNPRVQSAISELSNSSSKKPSKLYIAVLKSPTGAPTTSTDAPIKITTPTTTHTLPAVTSSSGGPSKQNNATQRKRGNRRKEWDLDKIRELALNPPILPTPAPQQPTVHLTPRGASTTSRFVATPFRSTTPFTLPYPTKSHEISTLLSKYMKEPFMSLISTYLWRVIDKQKWNRGARRLLLILYLHSPQAYHITAKMFKLPSLKVLRKWLNAVVRFYPGAQLQHLDLLNQGSLHLDDVLTKRFERKSCILTFRQVALRPILSYNSRRDFLEGLEDFGKHGRSRYLGTHALLFTVKGLLNDWTMPLACFTVSERTPVSILNELLLDCLASLEAVGLLVKVIVCTDVKKHWELFDLLEYTATKPFINFRSRRIMVMIDPVCLLKRMRHSLKRRDVMVGTQVASWSHVEAFIETDSQLGIRLCPHLHLRALNIPAFAPISLKKTKDVFHPKVAAGLSFYAQHGVLPKDAQATAKVIFMGSKLIDCFSGRKVRAPPDRPLERFIAQATPHLQFMYDSLLFLKQWQFVGGPENEQELCFRGWHRTMAALLQLWFEMKKFTRTNYLCTSRMTPHDPSLNKLFRNARKSTEGLTVMVCRETLRAYSVQALLSCPKKLRQLKASYHFTNYIVTRLKKELQDKLPLDKQRAVSQMSSAASRRPAHLSATAVTITTNSTATVSTDNTLSSGKTSKTKKSTEKLPELPAVNALSYLSGYVAHEVLSGHDNCDVCDDRWHIRDVSQRMPAAEFFAIWLSSSTNTTVQPESVVVPSGEFVNLINTSETVFMLTFPYLVHQNRVSSKVFRYIRQNLMPLTKLTMCRQLRNELIQCFVKIRIPHAVKEFNARLADNSNCSKRVIKFTTL